MLRVIEGLPGDDALHLQSKAEFLSGKYGRFLQLRALVDAEVVAIEQDRKEI